MDWQVTIGADRLQESIIKNRDDGGFFLAIAFDDHGPAAPDAVKHMPGAAGEIGLADDVNGRPSSPFRRLHTMRGRQPLVVMSR